MRSTMRPCAAFASLAGAALARAGETAKSGAEKLHDLGLAGGKVEGPGLGRVLLVFLLAVAIAWGVTWVLRRYGLRFRPAAAGAATPIRHLARSTLPGGITCHVIEAQARQVLVTVSRHGVSTLLLGEAAAGAAVPAGAAEPPPASPVP